MEIRVLGCYGSQIPGYGLTGFLIDAKTLLDAGAVTSVLTLEEQAGVDHILITHAHLDHIRELASLADNICYLNREDPLTVVGTPLVIETLKKHIFNGIIWPDFSAIPSTEKPVLRDVAKLSGHLTPAGLAGELKKLGPFDYGIYLYHMKIQYREKIRREIDLLQIANIHLLQDGQVIRI